MNACEEFYNTAYSGNRYSDYEGEDEHFAIRELREFVAKYRLSGLRCLEVGSGGGNLQDLVEDYTGLDLCHVVARKYHKPFVSASAELMPFADNEFDAVWSVAVLEHIPNPERALQEMRRVLKQGGLLLLKPAWNCRPWICEGIPVRPYRDLSFRQKWIKLTLPIRDSVVWRAMKLIPKRLWNSWGRKKAEIRLKYDRLKADYQTFWMVDSDACSCIDSFDAIEWFRSRGDDVLSHPSWLSAILSRSEHLIVRIVKQPLESGA